MIKLRHFSNHDLAALKAFELPLAQAKFTALPKEILSEGEGVAKIIIAEDDQPVGFFLLHQTTRVKEYSPNPKAILLTALSVNYAKQGKGYAKQGMRLLKEFVKTEFTEVEEIVLGVNHKNIPAQNLYVSVGFIDTGRRKIGPLGEQLILRLSL